MADRDHELDLAWQVRIGIWVAQGVLCAYGIGIGFAALSNPAMFPPGIGYDFVLQVPDLAARAFGALLVVLGIGVLVPSAMRVRPMLAPLSAVGIGLIQAVLIVVHAMSGQIQSMIAIDLMVILIAGMVAWGRSSFAPIAPR